MRANTSTFLPAFHEPECIEEERTTVDMTTIYKKDEKRLRRQFLVHFFHRLFLFYLVEGNERLTAWKFVMDEYNNERRKHILISHVFFLKTSSSLTTELERETRQTAIASCVLSENFLQ
jgi:hypothetical protein